MSYITVLTNPQLLATVVSPPQESCPSQAALRPCGYCIGEFALGLSPQPVGRRKNFPPSVDLVEVIDLSPESGTAACIERWRELYVGNETRETGRKRHYLWLTSNSPSPPDGMPGRRTRLAREFVSTRPWGSPREEVAPSCVERPQQNCPKRCRLLSGRFWPHNLRVHRLGAGRGCGGLPASWESGSMPVPFSPSCC